MMARGGVEAGRGHYRAMVAFHAAFLPALAAAAIRDPRPPPPVAWLAVAGALLAQALRWWAVAALRGRWTTRVIVLTARPMRRASSCIVVSPCSARPSRT